MSTTDTPRYVVIDRDATAANPRANTSINPRYWIQDTETREIIDGLTSAKVARDTARDMNRAPAPAANTTAAAIAELVVLDTYNTIRGSLHHDYGNGQREHELMRRRRTMRELRAPEYPTFDDVDGPELVAAYERVGKPRANRAEREEHRRTTPSTMRTLRAWKRTYKLVQTAAGNNDEHTNAEVIEAIADARLVQGKAAVPSAADSAERETAPRTLTIESYYAYTEHRQSHERDTPPSNFGGLGYKVLDGHGKVLYRSAWMVEARAWCKVNHPAAALTFRGEALAELGKDEHTSVVERHRRLADRRRAEARQ